MKRTLALALVFLPILGFNGCSTVSKRDDWRWSDARYECVELGRVYGQRQVCTNYDPVYDRCWSYANRWKEVDGCVRWACADGYQELPDGRCVTPSERMAFEAQEQEKRERARALEEQALAALDGDDPEALRTLGERLAKLERFRTRNDIEADPTAAVPLFERACELGDGAACRHLSDLLPRESADEAEFVGRDWRRALDPQRERDLLVRACELGHGQTCAGLGDAYARGVVKAAPADPRFPWLGLTHPDLYPASEARAIQTWKRGCELEDYDSCFVITALYLPGEAIFGEAGRLGLQADADTARDYLAKLKVADARRPHGLGNLGWSSSVENWHRRLGVELGNFFEFRASLRED